MSASDSHFLSVIDGDEIDPCPHKKIANYFVIITMRQSVVSLLGLSNKTLRINFLQKKGDNLRSVFL